jgi:hypothetical protein
VPYNREQAGKGGHADFVRNPDVQTFLSNCDYLRIPSDEEAERQGASFAPAANADPPLLPRYVVASDASKSDTPISDKLPSTQIGFLKVSHVLVDLSKYASLTNPDGPFIDPFKVADMHRSAAPVTFTMPGTNVRYKGQNSVKSGFRQSLFDQLSVNRGQHQGTPFVLADALLELNSGEVHLRSCSVCGASHDEPFTANSRVHKCIICQAELYMTDWLRLHEGISDFGDNASAMTRMMNAVEHLMLAAFIQQVFAAQPAALSNIAFVLDGPLAIFGEPAKLSQRLQALVFRANCRLRQLNLNPMLVIGLQKTGVLMDHALLLERFIPNGTFRVVDDAYRNTYITGTDSPAANFGNETYYGQDFLFKTERGRMFNFAIPYPSEDKTAGGGGEGFARFKIDLGQYGDLPQRAFDLIRHFEMDLYDNSIVPVALAHRHASISLMPGGKVLDLLVRSGLAVER